MIARSVSNTKEGEIYFQKVDVPKGDPSNQMSRDEINAKFKILAQEGNISEVQAEEVVTCVEKLDEMETLSAFIEKLVLP